MMPFPIVSLKMTISNVITKYYYALHSYCNPDMAIAQSRTGEDILHDVCITAIKKYKENEVTEEEALSYLKKTLYTEQLFQKARLKKEKVIYMEDITSLGV